MNISVNKDGQFQIIKLSGNLDALAVQDIRPELEALMETPGNIFLVDGSELQMLDSSGIGFLVHLFKSAKASNDQLALVGMQGQADDMLRFLKIDQVVPYFGNLIQAKEEFSGN